MTEESGSGQRSGDLPVVTGSAQGAEDSGAAPGRGKVSSVGYAYSGPLPHPEIVRQYEALVPGAAERILTQFEQQSAHRREMERAVISSNSFSQRVGSISASVIGMMGVGGGVWLTYLGRSMEGLGTLLATLGSLVGAYLYSRREQEMERADKGTQLKVAARQEGQ